MVVGDSGYQLQISRLAAAFNGAIGMEYLQDAGYARINELCEHSQIIAEDMKVG